jgi:hypothetical protein
MMRCPRIVLRIGFALVGPARVSLAMLIPKVLNMGIKTWLYFIRAAPSTAFSVKTGILGKT